MKAIKDSTVLYQNKYNNKGRVGLISEKPA